MEKPNKRIQANNSSQIRMRKNYHEASTKEHIRTKEGGAGRC